MEDKLKELFDALDEKEVDELLKDIRTDDIKVDELSAKRISKNVLKKTGAAHKWINKNTIAIVASAAALVISVGVIGLVRNNNTMPKSTQSDAPLTEDAAIEEEPMEEAPVYDKMVAEAEPDDYSAEEEIPEYHDNEEVQKADRTMDQSAPGSIVDSAAAEGKEYASDAENNSKSYKNMSSGDIEKMLDDAEYDVDYSGFANVNNINLSDIENESDYVVIGEKTGSSFVSADDPADDNLTLVADFNIREDKTGVMDNGLSGTIRVNEGIRYNPVINVLISSCEYTHMKNGKTYILFLKKVSEGRYDIVGGIYGKIPVDTNEKLYIGASGQTDKKAEENLAEYKEIVKNARKKYLSDHKNDDPEDDVDHEEEPTTDLPADETPDTPEPTKEPESTPEPEETVH